MTDVQDGIRFGKVAEQDDDKTAPIRIPAQVRQSARSQPVPAQPTSHRARPVAPQAAAPQMAPMPQAPQMPPRNGFGITALCLSLVALVFMLIPLTGFIAVILGGLALVFGVLGSARARRGQATNGKMAATGTVLGALGLVVGVIGVVIVFQATAQFSADMDRLTGTNTSSAPYVGAPAEPAPAASTSYTYEVTGNYSAGSLSYTDSNGDSTMDVEGTKLPWKKTVKPEPNGKGQYLSASTMSTKGNSWVTCTLKDDKGKVVDTQTGRGAYASCTLMTN